METCSDCSNNRRIAVEAVIDVIDGCESAFEQIGGEERSVWDGIRMLYERSMRRALTLGIEPIGEVGDRFDPELHDAFDTVESFEPDMIEDVIRLGWFDKENDSLIRVARVVVGTRAKPASIPKEESW